MGPFIEVESELQFEAIGDRRRYRIWNMYTSSTSLFRLPYEIRQMILQYALKEKGTVELQQPVWAGLSAWSNPLFQVCRSLRNEALKAFYESNDFLWIVDVDNELRSDPATYRNRRKSITLPMDSSLISVLPWHYPDLMKRLRHLQINIYLPQERNACVLEDRLKALVEALDAGRRLASIHVLITAKRRGGQFPLTVQERKALESLAQMEVRGMVKVQAGYSCRAVGAGVRNLNLQKRMMKS